jgi:tryptophan 7-dimethylallyltransferase
MHMISDCMSALGLEDKWSSVASFIESRPAWHRATPLFVCVGTGPSVQNRAKIYFRTQARSLKDIISYMTLDGNADVISSDDNSQTLAALPRLWTLLFGSDMDETQPVQSLDPNHLMSGHVVYYDIALTTPFPRCKLSINVKHFCKNDADIAAAIADYYREAGHTQLGDSYEKVVRSML